MASNARTADPPFAGAFKLEVDGVTIGAFTEVTGLAVQLEVEEIAEGGNNQSTIKVPGRLKWPNLVLKRGITDNDSLFEWLAECSGDGFETGSQDHQAERQRCVAGQSTAAGAHMEVPRRDAGAVDRAFVGCVGDGVGHRGAGGEPWWLHLVAPVAGDGSSARLSAGAGGCLAG